MPRVSDALLAELDLKRADHPTYEWGDDPGSEVWRAGLTHLVLMRMLESAETLAPFWKVSREVAFSSLRDLVIEEAERSPFGLAAIEKGTESERQPTAPGPESTPGRRSVSAESTGGDGGE